MTTEEWNDFALKVLANILAAVIIGAGLYMFLRHQGLDWRSQYDPIKPKEHEQTETAVQ